ncbi:MAG: DUF393 domain-containing protein [Halothiobacillaceae bacterium]|nr:DUF393 domain-containing protein [Halothiobacillaceae bacterium]
MTDQHADTSRPAVFFDGSCPLCAREIRHYRRQPGAEAIRWVDASRDVTSLAAAGLDRESAMRRLHAREASGDWAVGLPAFLLIWRHLPRYRWLGRALGWWLLRPLVARLYDAFADRRHRRRCKRGCSLPGEN